MITDIEKLFEDALKLPDKMRAEMAASLIDSLDKSRDTEVEESWEVRIQRRLDELDRGNVKAITWPDARRLILKE